MKTALLVSIQRGSLHDGPGVRVTYFFKGCNLECGWCHNPESRKARPEIMRYPEKCLSCGLCKEVCENREGCVSCGRCALVCPTGARVMSAAEYTIEDMLSVAFKEAPFFGKEGGVTCSGGEPMLQIEALKEFLMLCKKHNIHTAVDTALNVPWQYFEEILPYTDVILADYKHHDEALHIKYTGVSRSLIAENLQRLIKSSVEVIIRMPIIPGIHDSLDYITAAGRELADWGFNGKVELLPFHRSGCSKYLALGLPYEFAETLPPDNETMKTLAEGLRKFGVKL